MEHKNQNYRKNCQHCDSDCIVIENGGSDESYFRCAKCHNTSSLFLTPTHKENWRDRIRTAYAGIVSDEQIQATIEYWEAFIENVERTAIERGRAQALEEVVKSLDENIAVTNFSHSVGSHSDDRGGDSDIECTCMEKEEKYQTEALETFKKKLLSALTKDSTHGTSN